MQPHPELPIPNPIPPQLTPSKPPKNALAIAIVVSLVFLFAAAIIGAWLIKQKESSPTGGVPQTSDTENVTKVSFVAPKDLPSKYASRDQNIGDATNTYYYDPKTSCGITATTMPVTDEKSNAKDTVVSSTKTAEAIGVKVASQTDGETYTLKDVDGSREYAFSSIELVQNVDVPGINFNKQTNVVSFAQFGGTVASLGYSCKNSEWTGKKSELRQWVSKFTIKTER